MATPDVLFLIEKYLKKNISDDELITLKKLLENDENTIIFKSLVKDDYQLKIKNVSFNAKESFAKIEPRLETVAPKKVIRLKPLYKYAVAASVLLVVALTVFLNTQNGANQFVTPIIVNTNIEPGTDKATLTLEDGTFVTLEKGNIYQTQNVNSNGDQIVYKAGEKKPIEIAYNYLTIPRGGQYHIILSDGTQIWLNSDSQLKYPVNFKEGETRQVELIYGEAYFDVSPSTDHKGSKFKVFNQFQEVEVLGTEFNIKAYRKESNIYTTLVEGEVAVNCKNEVQNLTPNQQSKWNPNTKSLVVNTVDVYNEISWKYGVFSFDNKPLNEIMKILSRWYDVDIMILNKEIEKTEFVGVIRKNKNIENILLNLKNFEIIKDYEINDKVIILK